MSVTISALPAASALDGSEAVPIVQAGVTVRATTQDIADLASPDVDVSNATGVLAIEHGGTGETTSADALNALLPDQTGHSGEFLTTDGTNASWASGGGGGGDLTLLSSAPANVFVDQTDGSTGTLFSMPFTLADFSEGDFFELEAQWRFSFGSGGEVNKQFIVDNFGGLFLVCESSGGSTTVLFTLRAWGQVNAGVGFISAALYAVPQNNDGSWSNGMELLTLGNLDDPIAPTYQIVDPTGGESNMPFFGATLTRLT